MRDCTLLRFNARSILEWCDRRGKPSRRLTVEDCAFSTCLMPMSDILVDSKLYNNDGRPTDFHRYVLASEDSPPGYVQPTPTRLYIALRHAWIRFSVLLAYDKFELKTVPKISISSTFCINLPPKFHLGGLLKGIWPATMHLVLLMPKEKRHFLAYDSHRSISNCKSLQHRLSKVTSSAYARLLNVDDPIFIPRSLEVNSCRRSFIWQTHTCMHALMYAHTYTATHWTQPHGADTHGWRKCVGLIIQALTHWGRVMHICASKLTIIGSDNGLSPCQH